MSDDFTSLMRRLRNTAVYVGREKSQSYEEISPFRLFVGKGFARKVMKFCKGIEHCGITDNGIALWKCQTGKFDYVICGTNNVFDIVSLPDNLNLSTM